MSLYAFVSAWYFCRLITALSLFDSNKSLSSASVGEGMASNIVLELLCLILSGVTTSASNSSRNIEKFVALETDVLWLHITFSITSAHLPFFLPSRIFLIALKIRVLALYCTIRLRVVDWGKGYLRSYLMAEILEHVIVKLFGIVEYDFSWDTETAGNVLSKKLLNCRGAYVGDRLRLNPLGKILDCYNGEGVIASSWS
jgi:hypothetical protein